jgi:hypothetical protein
MGRSVELRQAKRYRLTASVQFSWDHSEGSTIRGEGHTRDISATGVFVLTSHQLPLGTAVKLQVSLPSLRTQQSPGASLRTVGHVVRLEALGFAAAADMGFRMQFPKTRPSRWSVHRGNSDGEKHDARPEETRSSLRSLQFALSDVSRCFVEG